MPTNYSTTTEIRPTAAEQVVKIAEPAVKTAGIIAAFGYMSLRAHLNHLGVSAPPSIDAQRYMMEVYYLISWLLLPLGFIGALILFSDQVKFLRWRVAPLFRCLIPSTPRRVVLWLALLLVAAFGIVMSAGDEIVVGKLQLRDSPTGWAIATYLILVSCVIKAWQLFAQRNVTPDGPVPSFWKPFAILTLAAALDIPWLFGVAVHHDRYPIALISQKEKAETCGLLLLQTKDDLTLWHATNGIGEMVTIPRTEATRLRTGKIFSILEQANGAAANHASAPDCKKGFPQ